MHIDKVHLPRVRPPRIVRFGLYALLLLLIVATAIEVIQPGLLRSKTVSGYYRAAALTWMLPQNVFNQLTGETGYVDWNNNAVHVDDISKTTVEGHSAEEFAHTPLLPAGSEWKYLDYETDPGSNWRAPGYDDSAWKTGLAPLGTGQENAETELASFAQLGTQPHTIYLRSEFKVEDPLIYRTLDLELLRNDGIVIYLNGAEIFRGSLPSAEAPFQSPGPSAASGSGKTYFHQNVDASLLKRGRNVLAVELNQTGSAGQENSFDLILRGALRAVSVRFAVIGDYGASGPDAEAVANLVKSWKPDLIITTGDNNYPDGAAKTLDNNLGQYYHDFIYAYRGRYGSGANQNRFFPTLGNHDWGRTPDEPSFPNAYLNYFTLPSGPGDERYYDFTWGPVHFFALDSDINEPDGNTATSKQAGWLKSGLQQSGAPWKLVYMHHAPFSSAAVHPPDGAVDWPFASWGASVVMSGHDHFYERIEHENLPYIVNGLGGGIIYETGTPVDGSQVRFNDTHGAMLVQASPCHLLARFISVNGEVIDTFQLENPADACR